jgi:hypothetical protein
MFADVIVDDRNGRPIALVEIMAAVTSREELQEFTRQLSEIQDPSVTFGFIVDLENIYLLKRDNQKETFVLIAELNTREILGHYAPEFAGKDSRYVSSPIFHDYVETLVEGWLRDLAYHWKSADPPGAEVLAETGILERIDNGMTRRTESAAGVHSLA